MFGSLGICVRSVRASGIGSASTLSRDARNVAQKRTIARQMFLRPLQPWCLDVVSTTDVTVGYFEELGRRVRFTARTSINALLAICLA